jgi:hypothetical protein
MIVYVTITLLVPFATVQTAFLISKNVMNGKRPPISSSVPAHWQDLIERYWA